MVHPLQKKLREIHAHFELNYHLSGTFRWNSLSIRRGKPEVLAPLEAALSLSF